MKANIEISESDSQEVSNFLNRLLANEYVLSAKTRSAHWNVECSNFIGLHKFLGEQYAELDLILDDVAERVRCLGHYAIGTLKDYLNYTDMLESDGNCGDQRNAIEYLTLGHETIIHTLRREIPLLNEKYKDLGTADFITGIMKQHEKMSWMLRAHLNEN